MKLGLVSMGYLPYVRRRMRKSGLRSAAAKEELRDPERRLYWMTHAAEMGYKTARGACVAHHIRQIKAEEESEQRRQRSMEDLREWAEEARARRERRRREMEEEMNRPVSEEGTGCGGAAAGEAEAGGEV